MIDTTPDRISLWNIEKNAMETFREYAHKWRDLAVQVQPPMIDKELNKMFLNTLKAPYYDRMIENSNTNFSDVVSVGEMIENGVKLDKIESVEAKKSTFKKKEGETHAVSYERKAYNPTYSRQPDRGYQSYNQYAGGNSQGNYQPNIRPVASFPALPAPAYGGNSQPSGQQGNNARGERPQQERPKFDPIPMIYIELYPKLVQLGLLVPMDIPPM